MDDTNIAVLVIAATLAVLGFFAVQWKLHQARHRRTLSDMYRPAPKAKNPPPGPE
ncbi:MAG: hypothetical protein ABMA26_25000 [Limisphaerales bacterium]